MSDQPQPGYNPHAVGAMGGGGAPGAGKPMFGIPGPPPLGSSIQSAAPLGKNIPVSFMSDKGTGWKDKMQGGLGIRTRAEFSGEIQDLTGGMQAASAQEIFGSSDGGGGGDWGGATYEQIYGSGVVILQNGGELRGAMPESMLTGMGAITPPATPSMGTRSEGMEIG